MSTEKKTTEAVTEKKAPVNILDMLLGADVEKVKLPVKQFEIKRLSEAFGAPFVVTLKACSADKWEELQDMALSISGKDVELDTNLMQTFIVMESVYEDEAATKLLFKNKELMAKYKATTPKDLVKSILLSGEIIAVYSAVADLSGFGDDAITEVKN